MPPRAKASCWVANSAKNYTGSQLPRLDFSRLGKNVAAYGLLIEIHYRHYQFGSMFLDTGEMGAGCCDRSQSQSRPIC